MPKELKNKQQKPPSPSLHTIGSVSRTSPGLQPSQSALTTQGRGPSVLEGGGEEGLRAVAMSLTHAPKTLRRSSE